MATLFIPLQKYYSFIKPKILIIYHSINNAYKLALIDLSIQTNNSKFQTNKNVAIINEENFKIVFFSREGDELVIKKKKNISLIFLNLLK